MWFVPILIIGDNCVFPGGNQMLSPPFLAVDRVGSAAAIAGAGAQTREGLSGVGWAGGPTLMLGLRISHGKVVAVHHHHWLRLLLCGSREIEHQVFSLPSFTCADTEGDVAVCVSSTTCMHDKCCAAHCGFNLPHPPVGYHAPGHQLQTSRGLSSRRGYCTIATHQNKITVSSPIIP